MRPKTERLKRRFALRNTGAIRNAIVASVDVNQVTEAWYQLHHPDASSMTVTTAQARDWAMVSITVDTTKLREALARLYADAWVLGQAITEKELTDLKKKDKLDYQVLDVYNPNWSPGNRPAAELLRSPAGLQRLLSRIDSVSNEISRTTKKRIGTILGNALEAGLPPSSVSILIDQLLDDPVRALTIAQTEMSDAVVQASRELYLDSGVEMVEYLVADPCDECAENEKASPIPIGEDFPNGYPPVHPNCMCDIAPYTVDTREKF